MAQDNMNARVNVTDPVDTTEFEMLEMPGDPPARLFVVETIHTFRMRYLVEDVTAAWAEETVIMNPDAIEWHQKFIGDTIVSTRPISREEAEEMHALDDGGGCSWLDFDSVILWPRDNDGDDK